VFIVNVPVRYMVSTVLLHGEVLELTAPLIVHDVALELSEIKNRPIKRSR